MDPNAYETSSIETAAILLAHDCPALLPRLIGRRVVFKFGKPSRANAVAADFAAGVLEVNAQKFISALKSIRDTRDLTLSSNPAPSQAGGTQNENR